MKGLGLCCSKGCDVNFDFESEPKNKIIVPERTESSCHKPRDASVIPPKRKCVKKMVCSCFIECLCGKSLNTSTKTKTNTKTNTKALYGAGNYGK